MKKNISLFVAVLILLQGSAFAGFEADSNRQNKKTEQFESGAFLVSPILLPTYTPELNLALGAGAMVSFKTKRNNEYLGHSVLPILLGVNTKGDLSLNTKLSSRWIDDKILFDLVFHYENMLDNYWGVGSDNAKNIEKGELTTQYQKDFICFSPEIYFRLITSLYLGGRFVYCNTNAHDLNNLMQEDINVVKYGTSISSTAAGFTILYDTRDFPYNAIKGLYLNLSGLFFDETLGSDYTFRKYSLDYRQYVQVMRMGSTLGWQLKANLGSGDIPWTDLHMLGSSYDFRGYYYGKYRDNSLAFLLMEYRHRFSKISSSVLSKHSAVLWFGGGSVFNTLNEANMVLLNMGLGYRYQIQTKMNFRVDLGFGDDSWGLYLSINEAF